MQTRFAPSTRARDEDRVHACTALDEAFADGQLAADEYELRLELAKDAHTLDDLHDLVDDLQGETELASATVIPRTDRRGIVVRWAILLVVAVAVFFGVRACASDSSATGVYGSAGYLSPDALDYIVTSVPALVGTTVVDELGVYPAYALLTVADPSNPRRAQTYSYRDGDWERGDDENRDPSTVPVDLADLAPGALPGLVSGAPTTLNIESVDSMYVYLRSEESTPSIFVYAANAGANENGNFGATLTGDFTRVSAFDPTK